MHNFSFNFTFLGFHKQVIVIWIWIYDQWSNLELYTVFLCLNIVQMSSLFHKTATTKINLSSVINETKAKQRMIYLIWESKWGSRQQYKHTSQYLSRWQWLNISQIIMDVDAFACSVKCRWKDGESTRINVHSHSYLWYYAN